MSRANLHAVIMAGGRGTRFWPRSRSRTPKQLLPILGDDSLLQRTVRRLAPLVPPERVWIFTSELLRNAVRKQLPGVPANQIVAEPVQRNTAPCIALAARLIAQEDPGAVIGVFPSDHLIADEIGFLQAVERAARAAREDVLVTLGIQPRWAETGYGYIEFPTGTVAGGAKAVPVTRFWEKPGARRAKRFVEAGNFYWNSGMFVWRAATISAAVANHLPDTATALEDIPRPGSRAFSAKLRKRYPLCDNISIDYGVLEKAKNLVGFPVKDFGWSDVGSWEALYALARKDQAGNAFDTPVELLDAAGNFVDAPGKLVALVNVKNLVIVDTPDAILICPRKDAQKVSALVKALEKTGWDTVL